MFIYLLLNITFLLLLSFQKKAGKKSAKIAQETVARRTIPEFSASNIDDALDLLSLDDKLKAKDIEKHPERRFKAALAAFEER